MNMTHHHVRLITDTSFYQIPHHEIEISKDFFVISSSSPLQKLLKTGTLNIITSSYESLDYIISNIDELEIRTNYRVIGGEVCVCYILSKLSNTFYCIRINEINLVLFRGDENCYLEPICLE